LSLSWSHDGTSKEDEVFIDDTVMWETTNWSNVLLIWILFGGGIVSNTFAGTGTNSVDLLVKLSSVEVTFIT